MCPTDDEEEEKRDASTSGTSSSDELSSSALREEVDDDELEDEDEELFDAFGDLSLPTLLPLVFVFRCDLIGLGVTAQEVSQSASVCCKAAHSLTTANVSNLSRWKRIDDNGRVLDHEGYPGTVTDMPLAVTAWEIA